MINTVHEDDLAVWYRLPEAGQISISDFELDDEDWRPEFSRFLTMETATGLQVKSLRSESLD